MCKPDFFKHGGYSLIEIDKMCTAISIPKLSSLRIYEVCNTFIYKEYSSIIFTEFIHFDKINPSMYLERLYRQVKLNRLNFFSTFVKKFFFNFWNVGIAWVLDLCGMMRQINWCNYQACMTKKNYDTYRFVSLFNHDI